MGCGSFCRFSLRCSRAAFGHFSRMFQAIERRRKFPPPALHMYFPPATPAIHHAQTTPQITHDLPPGRSAAKFAPRQNLLWSARVAVFFRNFARNSAKKKAGKTRSSIVVLPDHARSAAAHADKTSTILYVARGNGWRAPAGPTAAPPNPRQVGTARLLPPRAENLIYIAALRTRETAPGRTNFASLRSD